MRRLFCAIGTSSCWTYEQLMATARPMIAAPISMPTPIGMRTAGTPSSAPRTPMAPAVVPRSAALAAETAVVWQRLALQARPVGSFQLTGLKQSCDVLLFRAFLTFVAVNVVDPLCSDIPARPRRPRANSDTDCTSQPERESAIAENEPDRNYKQACHKRCNSRPDHASTYALHRER